MKQVNYIAEVLISGDIQDTPEFVRVTFSQKMIAMIWDFQRFLRSMKMTGMKPAAIQFDMTGDVSILNPLGHHHLNKEEAATLVFESEQEKQRWKDALLLMADKGWKHEAINTVTLEY